MMLNECKMCGDCCRKYYINLNKEEYESGRFVTIFATSDKIENFAEAKDCGAVFLAKKENGDCIYLENDRCSIHEQRPSVCKKYFCPSSKKE